MFVNRFFIMARMRGEKYWISIYGIFVHFDPLSLSNLSNCSQSYYSNLLNSIFRTSFPWKTFYFIWIIIYVVEVELNIGFGDANDEELFNNFIGSSANRLQVWYNLKITNTSLDFGDAKPLNDGDVINEWGDVAANLEILV